MAQIDWLIDALWQGGRIRADASGLEAVGGGSINRALKVSTDRGPLFVKINSPEAHAMFAAEAEGLEALRRADGPRVPAVVAVGGTEAGAFIALEWLDLGAKSVDAERALGTALARQHRHTAAAFGWDRDNTIGATPQINTRARDWAAFFGEHRLGFQLELAERNGLSRPVADAARALLGALDAVLGDHAPAPALLHGDLWGGNWGAMRTGDAVTFDPAVYFGDRETDLAMTRLFGGFGPDFYAAYEAAWPLDRGWQRRVDLYNLYHLLNHFNLFGAGYAAAVGSAVDACMRGR